MRLIATAKPTETLLQMFNTFSEIPGEWIQGICGETVTGVRRGEYTEPDCTWKECVFVPFEYYAEIKDPRDSALFAKLRKDFGVNLSSDDTTYMFMHDGVFGVCAL